MDNKDQAFKRLLKKLSALRATLKSEERGILDGLIIRSVDEVGAHKMNIGARITPRVTPAADEAAAHRMNISQVTPFTASDADEAAAHKMNVGAKVTPRVTPAADEAAAHMMDMQIAFDPIEEVYRIVH